MKKVLVIGGTQYDTALGKEWFEKEGFEARAEAISENALQQSLMQYEDRGQLHKQVEELIGHTKLLFSPDAVVIYCNSLASCVRPAILEEKLHVPVYTPYDTYEKHIRDRRRAAVVAANAKSLYMLESYFMKKNPDLQCIGYSDLNIVESIEKGWTAKDLILRHQLDKLMHLFKTKGAECIILGCTHYSRLAEDIAKLISVPVIETTPELVQLVKDGRKVVY